MSKRSRPKSVAVTIRFPAEDHTALETEASRLDWSLNHLIVRLCSAYIGGDASTAKLQADMRVSGAVAAARRAGDQMVIEARAAARAALTSNPARAADINAAIRRPKSGRPRLLDVLHPTL